MIPFPPRQTLPRVEFTNVFFFATSLTKRELKWTNDCLLCSTTNADQPAVKQVNTTHIRKPLEPLLYSKRRGVKEITERRAFFRPPDLISHCGCLKKKKKTRNIQQSIEIFSFLCYFRWNHFARKAYTDVPVISRLRYRNWRSFTPPTHYVG